MEVDLCAKECDVCLQLPLTSDGGGLKPDLLREQKKGYHMRQTEDSKARLQWLLDNKSFRIKLQQESIDQLHLLVAEYKDGPPILDAEVLESVLLFENKLWQMSLLEEKIRVQQFTKDQITLLLYIYTMCLFSDRIGNDIETLAYRLKMMHQTHDSVWLLCDDVDLILPKVQAFVPIPQQKTGEDTTKQCPADEHEQQESQLLPKFKSRLEDWRENVAKQQRLHSKLSTMLQCWPQYPWVR